MRLSPSEAGKRPQPAASFCFPVTGQGALNAISPLICPPNAPIVPLDSRLQAKSSPAKANLHSSFSLPLGPAKWCQGGRAPAPLPPEDWPSQRPWSHASPAPHSHPCSCCHHTPRRELPARSTLWRTWDFTRPRTRTATACDHEQACSYRLCSGLPTEGPGLAESRLHLSLLGTQDWCSFTRCVDVGDARGGS